MYYVNGEGCLEEYYLIFSVEDLLAEGRRSRLITCGKCGQKIRIRFTS
ncbi:MAG: hypothetical protein ACTSP1_11445 [Candidatus Freyarchaeota archaeon]